MLTPIPHQPGRWDENRDMAKRCRAAGWRVVALDSGRAAMIAAPEALADLLLASSCG